MVELEDTLRLLVTLLALGIFVVALLAYRRRPTTRILLLVVAFGVYVFKGIFLSGEVLLEAYEEALESLGVVADAAFLLLVWSAFLRD